MSKYYRVLYLGQEQAMKSIIGLDAFLAHCPNCEVLTVIAGDKRNLNTENSTFHKLYKRVFDNFSVDFPFYSLEAHCIAKKIPFITMEEPRKMELTQECIDFKPDFLISNGWGWIIPESFLELPAIKALNCHSSLLPFYKGPSVYQHVLMNFEKSTGLSVHALTHKIDEGAIYAQKEVVIESGDTPSSLLYKLSKLSGEVIAEAMEAVVNEKEIVPNQKGFYVKKSTTKAYVMYRTLNRLRLMLGMAPKRYLVK